MAVYMLEKYIFFFALCRSNAILQAVIRMMMDFEGIYETDMMTERL